MSAASILDGRCITVEPVSRDGQETEIATLLASLYRRETNEILSPFPWAVESVRYPSLSGTVWLWRQGIVGLTVGTPVVTETIVAGDGFVERHMSAACLDMALTGAGRSILLGLTPALKLIWTTLMRDEARLDGVVAEHTSASPRAPGELRRMTPKAQARANELREAQRDTVN